jgi:hypothetical protein
MLDLSHSITALTAAAKTHRITVSPKRRKDGRVVCIKAGPVFDAHYGIETICSSVSPFYTAARILKDRGRTGLIEMWHLGAKYPSLTMPIEVAANLAVKEGNRSLRLATYKPFQGKVKGGQDTTPPTLSPTCRWCADRCTRNRF